MNRRKKRGRKGKAHDSSKVAKPHAGEALCRAHVIRARPRGDLSPERRAAARGSRASGSKGSGDIAGHVATCTWKIPAERARRAT